MQVEKLKKNHNILLDILRKWINEIGIKKNIKAWHLLSSLSRRLKNGKKRVYIIDCIDKC